MRWVRLGLAGAVAVVGLALPVWLNPAQASPWPSAQVGVSRASDAAVAAAAVTPTGSFENIQGFYASVTTGTGYGPADTAVYDDAHGGLIAGSPSPDSLSIGMGFQSLSDLRMIFQAPKGRSLRPGFYDQATPSAAEPRPSMWISGCDTPPVDGSFEIRELQLQPNGEVERLWLLFYEECNTGPRFGEIRIGLDTSTARVEPSTTRWPLAYPGEPGATLPVRLRAGTGADLAVSGVSVVGPDADAFTVVGDPCTGADLVAEDYSYDGQVHTCDVRVRFSPTRSGLHTARLRFSTSQGVRYSSLEGMGRPGQTDWTMSSDGEQPPGAEPTLQFTPAAWPRMGCERGPSSVSCLVVDPSTNKGHFATLSAGSSDVLVPGAYRDDDTYYGPLIDVDRSSFYCSQHSGSFDVHQVAFASDDPSELLRFDASYVDYCDNDSVPVRGRIQYQASDDTSAPGRVSGLAAARSSRSVALTWTNPGDTDYVGTVVRYLPGRTAPPRPDTGIGAYAGTGTGVTVGGLAPDAMYTFAVFTYDAAGNVSPARVVSVGSPPPQPGAADWYATVFRGLGPSSPASRSDVFDDANGVLQASATANQLDVRVSGGAYSYGREFSWTFAAPAGRPLRPGFYDQVTDLTSADERRPRADLRVAGFGPCNYIDGHFEIRDIHRLADGTVDRLWLLYELGCNSTNNGPVFGEVRIGLPPAAVRVESEAIRWPHPHGAILGWVPVWVRAVTSDLTVTGVDVTGPDAQDFVVRMQDCTGRVIPAGDRCLIYLRATPVQPGPHTARLLISTTAGTRSVALDATGPLGDTDWSMTSEIGDYIGQGRQWDYSGAADRFIVSGSAGLFHARVESGEVLDWDAEFRPPSGQRLVEGTTYENAPGQTSQTDRAYLTVWGHGRDCGGDQTGWFRVDQAQLSPSGEPQRVDITFEQHCSATDPALRGRIRYHAEPDVTPPAPAADVTVQRTGDRATVTWTNPTDTDYAGTVVRYLPGTTAPPRPDTGIGAYSGTGTSATVTGLDPDRHYEFAVLTYDHAGNVLQPPPLPVATRINNPTTVPDALTYGQSTQVAAQLTDEDRIPLPDEQLRLDSRRAGTTAWSPLTTLTTSTQGWAIYHHQPRTNREYRWVYAGANGLYGSTSRTLTVTVQPKVTATLSQTNVPRNTTITITGSVSPSHAGQRVSLQRYTNGTWTRLQTTTLSAHSNYRFTYTPTSAGTKTLRVLKPADADHATGWSPTRTFNVR